jgi:phosphatidylglycerophosphate synthase
MVNKIPDTYECQLDIYLLKFIDTHLHVYRRFNLTPNILTTFSLISGLLSAYNILNRNYGWAASWFTVAYYFDCADGKFARKYNMQTQFGDYYDHISDIFKIALVLYALYITNPGKYYRYQWIIYVLIILSTLHLGYQEVIYGSDESPALMHAKIIASLDTKPTHTIKYTRYFGCGSLMLAIAVIILFWGGGVKSSV